MGTCRHIGEGEKTKKNNKKKKIKNNNNKKKGQKNGTLEFKEFKVIFFSQ